jgi:hypothetical protein
MTVQELIDELRHLNPISPVYMRDGVHFMRKHDIARIEEEHPIDYVGPDTVTIIGRQPSGRG